MNTVNRAYNNSPTGGMNDWNKIFIGFVKDNNDATRMGRLRVWIPELAAEPENSDRWITVNYASPFAGATPVNDLRENSATFPGTQKSYGMWMIPPDIDNEVIVAFINGDPNRGVWLGCLYNQRMNHMVPGIPSGSIEEDTTGPVSEYNKADPQVNIADPLRPQFQPLNVGLNRQGLIGDFTRGQNSSGARRNTPSTVYGVLTPRGSQLVFDDGFRQDELPTANYKVQGNPAHEAETESNRTTNKRDSEYIRFRTRSGAQVMISETDGFVYFISRDGKSWMEISNNGEVDLWGFQDVSVRSNHNINLLADQDVNIEAGRNINMKASKNWTAGGSQVQEDQGDGGDINFEARNDMNYKVVRDWNTDTGRDWLNLSGRDWKTTAGAQIHQKSGAESFHTSGGGFETNAGGDYVESAPNIHMNSFPATQADSTEEVEKIPQQNLKDKDAYNAQPFNWQDNRRKTIVQRVPQHEPYLAHDIRTTGLRGRVQETNVGTFNAELEDSSLEAQTAANRATHKPGSSPDTIETPQGRKVKTATTNQGEPVYQTTPGDGEFRPAASYDISDQGLEFIAKHEGFVPEIYSDVGNPAIGYGHNLTPQELEQGFIEAEGEKIFYENGITEEQARKILRKDAQIAANAVRQNTDVELTQSQFDSLTSFTFNVGTGAYNSSTLRRKLNQGKYESVPGEMARWNKAGGRINSGLVKRRDSEAELFTSST